MATKPYTRNIGIYTDPDTPLLSPQRVAFVFRPIEADATTPSYTPVIWLTLGFAKGQSSDYKTKWTSECGYSVAAVRDDNVVIAPSSTALKTGEIVKLTGDNITGHSWSAPKEQPDKAAFVAENDSGVPQNISLGMVTRKKPLVVQPVLLFKNVYGTGICSAPICPMMQIYKVPDGFTDHQQVLSGLDKPLLPGKGIDVRSLDQNTWFLLYSDPQSRAASLEKKDSGEGPVDDRSGVEEDEDEDEGSEGED